MPGHLTLKVLETRGELRVKNEGDAQSSQQEQQEGSVTEESGKRGAREQQAHEGSSAGSQSDQTVLCGDCADRHLAGRE